MPYRRYSGFCAWVAVDSSDFRQWVRPPTRRSFQPSFQCFHSRVVVRLWRREKPLIVQCSIKPATRRTTGGSNPNFMKSSVSGREEITITIQTTLTIAQRRNNPRLLIGRFSGSGSGVGHVRLIGHVRLSQFSGPADGRPAQTAREHTSVGLTQRLGGAFTRAGARARRAHGPVTCQIAAEPQATGIEPGLAGACCAPPVFECEDMTDFAVYGITPPKLLDRTPMK